MAAREAPAGAFNSRPGSDTRQGPPMRVRRLLSRLSVSSGRTLAAPTVAATTSAWSFAIDAVCGECVPALRTGEPPSVDAGARPEAQRLPTSRLKHHLQSSAAGT